MEEQKPCRHCRRNRRNSTGQIGWFISSVQLSKVTHYFSRSQSCHVRTYSILAYLKEETPTSVIVSTLLIQARIKARSIIHSFVSIHVSGRVVLRTPRVMRISAPAGDLAGREKWETDDWRLEKRNERNDRHEWQTIPSFEDWREDTRRRAVGGNFFSRRQTRNVWPCLRPNERSEECKNPAGWITLQNDCRSRRKPLRVTRRACVKTITA